MLHTSIIRKRTPGSPAMVVERLHKLLSQHNIILYCIVDHSKDMQARGATPPTIAYTIIFGNPLLGVKFLGHTPDTVVDIPLRMGVYANTEGSDSTVVYRSMQVLLADHGQPDLVPVAEKADKLLSSLAEALQTTGGS